MGKDLKGKELGVGICQRKDGLYTARFVSKRTGKTVQRYFPKLQECRKWYADARFEDEHGGINASIGSMLLSEVKPMHCQHVLNQMKDSYKTFIIYQTRITLYCMFADAVENDVAFKNPVTKAVKYNIGEEPKTVRALTVEEQRKFLEAAKGSSNYNQYAFILQTGLRTGEVIGLKWPDIDWEKRVLHIQRSMEYRHSVGEWRIGEPNKEAKVVNMQFTEFVFLCRKGEPTKNSAYDTTLFKLCDKAGIPRFSMHVLRHTMATRCIEGGMRPKTLQVIPGHSNVGIPMNLYVHVTEDERAKEVERTENALKVV